MAETEFSLVYDGPALVEHRIPVRDLAPALFALGELFDEANRIVNPDGFDVSLEITADEAGSFDVHLLLKTIEHAVDLFSGDAVKAIVNLRDLVIMGGVGVVWFIGQIRNRPITHQQPVPDNPSMTSITLNDGTTLTVPTSTLNMYRNVRIRQRAREVVAPVRQEGIDAVEFRRDQEVTVSVGSSDADAFDVPAEIEREYLTEAEFELVLTIVSPVLTEEDRSWRFNDGEHSFQAAVEDESFLARVAEGREIFRNGDRLRCWVRRRQYQSGRGIENEWTVLEVREHVRADPRSPNCLYLKTNQLLARST